MAIKAWTLKQVDKQKAVELAQECDLNHFTAFLLCARGIEDPMEADEFLSFEIDLPDPFSLPDMDKAVERVQKALQTDESIAVFGDYDADGVTSTALMYSVLSDLGANVRYHVPTRDEGYGMSKDAIDMLKAAGVSLIITVDNGIAAVEEIAYANSLGIDTVVTDHHLPPQELPDAVAVVDPKREDCFCDFTDYAGVGVAFLTACAIAGVSCEEMLPDYADLVTVGTIADVMPLRMDNRMIVKFGLKHMQNKGLCALIEAAGIKNGLLTAGAVAFALAPRLNAAGRMQTPQLAMDLLLAQTSEDAAAYAERLCEVNVQRQTQETEICEEAIAFIEGDPKVLFAPVLIAVGENWHHGVTGIVAARLMQRFGKPCIVFSIKDGIAKGSARSYSGVSIYSILKNSCGQEVKFGGHDLAAGITVSAQQLPQLIQQIQAAAAALYHPMPFLPLELCCKLNPAALSVSNALAQQLLQPFGQGNEQPVYGLYAMQIQRIVPVGGGKHLRLELRRDNAAITAMLFFKTEEEFSYTIGDIADFAVTLDVNTYNGQESLSVIIKEMRPSKLDDTAVFAGIRAYEAYQMNGQPPQMPPLTREELGEVYRVIRRKKQIFGDERTICKVFGTQDICRLRLMLDILSEENLITLKNSGEIKIEWIENAQKVNLNDSALFQKLSKGENQYAV